MRWFTSFKPWSEPLRAYKFLKAEHVDYLLSRQTIRVSKLSYYRGMEGPAWIADRMEGRTVAAVDDLEIRNPHTEHPALLGRLRQAGINIGAGYGTAIQNYRHIAEISDVFVFCVSIDPFESACASMTIDAPPDWRYNACVQIDDFGLFFDWILNTGVVVERGYAPAMTIFQGSSIAKVRYGNKTINLRNDAPIIPDVFLKEPIFSHQQEARFYLNPRDSVGQDHLHIRFEAPRGLLAAKSIQAPDLRE